MAVWLMSLPLWAQIDKNSLQATSYNGDTSAHAAYLEHKAWTYFEITSKGLELYTKHVEIIKIYDLQGQDYANFSIPLWREGGDRQKLSEVKGVTYNYVNGSVEKTKLEKKDIFQEERSEDLHIAKWAMPNVRAGSIIEISYLKRSPWVYTIPRFDFQMDVPITKVEYRVQIPAALTYTPIATGAHPIERKEETRSGKTGSENVFVFTAVDVPSLKDDDYVLDIDDYRTSLKYELYQTNFPGQTVNNYSKSWDDIAKNLMKGDHFGKQISKNTNELKDFISGLKNSTQEEKIKVVFEKIQNDYIWNKEYGYYTENGIKDILKKGSGNVGDINLLLINLLRQLDIKAQPLCLKSRWRGVLNPYYPSVSEMNYTIAYVPMDEEKYILLDATSKKVPLGQLPVRAVNTHGLLIHEDKGEIIPLQNPNNYNYTSLTEYTVDVEAPALVGKGRSLRKGFAATKYRIDQDITDDEEEEVKDQDEYADDDSQEEDNDIQLENEIAIVKVSGMDNIYDNVVVEYEERLYDALDVIGDQIFISAALDFGVKKNPFYEETRGMPIFFNYLHMTKHIATIEIPEGYQLDSAPDAIGLSLEDGSISFQYNTKVVGNKLNINYIFQVKNDVLVPNMYPGLKEIYARIIELSKQKIVLSPI